MASVLRTEPTVEPEGERELVRRARSGDRDAAAELLERHELVAWRVCRGLLPAGEDVEAAVQETLLRALRGLPGVAVETGFRGWLAAIAVNLCRDRLRRRRLVPFLPLEHGADDDDAGPLAVLPAPGPDPERVSMARQAVARVRREVARLPRRQREVFALRFFVGLELEAIAGALAVDVGTVKTHLHRAVQRVRRVAEEALP
jgi:RNA polymerase sigma-70 factor (ECF subfamily)